jgi:hypothetical protein
MCMKKYGRCPKFGRGDHSTCTYAHLQVVYYNCVKFHKNSISRLGGVALTRYMDGRTDGQMDRVIPIYLPNLFYLCFNFLIMSNIFPREGHVSQEYCLQRCLVILQLNHS